MKITSVWRFALAIMALIIVVILLVWLVLHLTEHNPAHKVAEKSKQTTSSQQQSHTPSTPKKGTDDSQGAPAPTAPQKSSQSPTAPSGTQSTTNKADKNLAHSGPGDVIRLFAMATIGGALSAHLYQVWRRRLRA